MTLNLQELEVFLAAADQGSFSGAARLLHLSQPAVSQSIQNLEQYLGAALFERMGRGVRLTDAGDSLLPMAQEIMTTSRRLEENMSDLHNEIAGHLVICCSTASGKYLLPGLIASFRKKNPRVQIDVIVKARDAVYDRLLAGQVNFGVSSKKLEHRDLQHMTFFQDEVVLIVAQDHPWAGFRRVHPDDLLDVPMILREDTSAALQVLLEGLSAHDITPDMLNNVMNLGNAEAIAIAVEEGIGVAFIPRLVAMRSIALGRVVEVEVEGLTLTHDIYFVRNQRCPMTRSQSALWSFFEHSHSTVEESLLRYRLVPELLPAC